MKDYLVILFSFIMIWFMWLFSGIVVSEMELKQSEIEVNKAIIENIQVFEDFSEAVKEVKNVEQN